MSTWRITEEPDDSGFGVFVVLAVIVGIISLILKALPFILGIGAVVGIVVLIVKLRKRSIEKKQEEEIRAREEKARAIEELTKWQTLLDRGTITKSEFETQKNLLFRKINQMDSTEDTKLLT